MNTKLHMAILVIYAIIIAPGCRPRQKTSTLQENRDAYAKNASNVEQGLIDQGVGPSVARLRGLLKAYATNFNFYGRSENGDTTRLATRQIKNFSFNTPILDKNGKAYEYFLLQSKNPDHPTFLGIKLILRAEKKVMNILLLEFDYFELKEKYKVTDIADITRQQLQDVSRDAENLQISFDTDTKEELKTLVKGDLKRMTSFFLKVEDRIRQAEEKAVKTENIAPQASNQIATENVQTQPQPQSQPSTEVQNKPAVQTSKDSMARPSPPSQQRTLPAQRAIGEGPTITKVAITLAFFATAMWVISWAGLIYRAIMDVPAEKFFKLTVGSVGTAGLVILIVSLVAVFFGGPILDHLLGLGRRNKQVFIFQWPKYLI